jgi:hypothetical protein
MYSVGRFIQQAGVRLGWEVDPRAQTELNVTDPALASEDDDAGPERADDASSP